MFLKTLGSLVLVSALLLAADSGAPEIRLWNGDAPGSGGKTAEEKWIDRGDGFQRVTDIHKPSIATFLPPKDQATGAAFIICPGGGHQYLAISLEGWQAARKLNALGVAGFVLKSRLARAEGSTYKVDVESLQDVQRAIRLVRSRAREWGIDPNRVGVMGYSAGGQLAVLAGTRFDAGKPDDADPVERFSSRPDFMVLGYPGVRADSLTITKETPPAFLVSAQDDRGPTNSNLAIYGALSKERVPAEIHLFARGGHGFGMDGRTPEFKTSRVGTWPELLRAWMADQGYLKK